MSSRPSRRRFLRAVAAGGTSCALPTRTGALPSPAEALCAQTRLLRNWHASAPFALHVHGFRFRMLQRATRPPGRCTSCTATTSSPRLRG